MKLVLFSGSHPRHLYVNKRVPEYFDEILIIVMERENLLPNPPKGLTLSDQLLFTKHFKNRNKVEAAMYGDLKPEEIFKNFKTIYINNKELNTHRIANEIEKFKPDFAFIFGVDLILEPVINKLPFDKVNLHLGLSPSYKGGATLYYPFYHLRPQFCGCTFHQITKQADAGEIIHQCVPKLAYGDKIHEVAAKCVLKATEDLPLLFKHWFKKKKFSGKKQKTSGKNWIGSDFHASQLRVIYELFDDDIVDKYLDGELEQKQPNIFSCLEEI